MSSTWAGLLFLYFIFGLTIANANITTPNIVGLTVNEATSVLQKSGLIVGTISEQETHHPSGSILVQAPKAGKSVAENTVIRLVVAIPRKQPDKTTVPDLQGISLEAAKIAIQKANLTLGSTQKRKKEVEDEIILYQMPPAGSQLIVNSKVNLILSDPIPLTSPRVKLLSEKRHVAVGEKQTFRAKVLNPPKGEVPVFSFTIDRKLHKTNTPEFTHQFITEGRHNVIASVRYGRKPWIASLTQTIHVDAQGSSTTVISKPNNKPQINNEEKPLTDSSNKALNIRLSVDKKRFNVGESTLLSIQLKQAIAPENLRFAFTINGKAYYTNKPQYKLLLSKQGKYIITSSVRYKREPWIASPPIAITSELNHSGLSSRPTSMGDSQKIVGTRVKALIDKLSYQVGETVSLSIDACNVPRSKKPRYSFTIDGNVHYSPKPSLQHIFKQTGKHIITASIRYDREDWIPSLTKIINVIPVDKRLINKQIKMPNQHNESYKTVPNVVGLSVSKALSKLRKAGVKGITIGKSKTGVVQSQNPVAYSCAITKSAIKLSTKKGTANIKYTAIDTDIKPTKNSIKKTQVVVTPKAKASNKILPTKVSKKSKPQDKATEKKVKHPATDISTNDNALKSPTKPQTPSPISTVAKTHKINKPIKKHTPLANAVNTAIANVDNDISDEEYVSALSYEYQAISATEENTSELAAIYYSLASTQQFESDLDKIGKKRLEKLQPKSENNDTKSTAKVKQPSFANNMEKIYLLASKQHIIAGNKVDFTLTRTIAKFDSTYYVVFHEEGEIIPVKQSKLSYTFNNWGIQTIYAEAETPEGVIKSKLVHIWVWPIWLLFIIISISTMLLLFFLFLRKKKTRKNSNLHLSL